MKYASTQPPSADAAAENRSVAEGPQEVLSWKPAGVVNV
jgi:hypothetical protein